VAKVVSATFYTIGIYDTTRESFFGSLEKHKVTHFCDIRLRRGLRGSLYKYGNAGELTKTLEEMGIEYRHVLDLAPTQAVREKQFRADKEEGISSGRQRHEISPDYEAAYRKNVLAKFNLSEFIEQFPSRAKVVLFCVEHEAGACHRSLVAAEIAKITGKSAKDITP